MAQPLLQHHFAVLRRDPMNRTRILAPILYLLIALIAGQLPAPAHAERIRDLGQFEGCAPTS